MHEYSQSSTPFWHKHVQYEFQTNSCFTGTLTRRDVTLNLANTPFWHKHGQYEFHPFMFVWNLNKTRDVTLNHSKALAKVGEPLSEQLRSHSWTSSFFFVFCFLQWYKLFIYYYLWMYPAGACWKWEVIK